MLCYFKVRTPNFGDDLNPWLWSRLAPEIAQDTTPTLFVGIGTILTRWLPAEPVKVVFGPGTDPASLPTIDATYFFYAVRGPMTARALNLSPSVAITDPAILVRSMPLPVVTKKFPVSFMPHHQSFQYADWAGLCHEAGIHCVDPRGTVDGVLEQVRQTELLLTEAMHGAIVADALRVPWIPVRLYPQFCEFKWQDWAESLQIDLSIASVPPVFQRSLFSAEGLVQTFKKTAAELGVGKEKWNRYPARSSSPKSIRDTLKQLQQLAVTRPGVLSGEHHSRNAEARLLQRLADVRADWRKGAFQHR